MPSMTLSPATGNALQVVPVIATGFETFWKNGTTAFFVEGGQNTVLQNLVVLSNTRAVFDLDTGTIPAVLTITDSDDNASGTFTVSSSIPAGPLLATYDVSTPLGQLRFKIGDMDVSRVDPSIPRSQWSAMYADQELQVFLDQWGGDVDWAAIMALRHIAARPEMQARAIHILNLEMDIGDLATSLNNLADEIFRSRTQIPAEVIAEVGNNDFDYRRIIWNQIQRRGGGGPFS